jgi:DNA-binding GntR family transcriptional regulator
MTGNLHVMGQLRLDGVAPVGLDTTLVQRVADRLRETIKTQKLVRGDTLPSEIDIAEALKVSKPVVGKALDQLEREGTVQKRVGALTTITDPPA